MFLGGVKSQGGGVGRGEGWGEERKEKKIRKQGSKTPRASLTTPRNKKQGWGLSNTFMT